MRPARRPSARPRLESLEDRTAPATHTFTHLGLTFNWSDPLNWDSAGVPTSDEPGGTIVVFNDSGVTSDQDIPGLVVDVIEFTNTGNTVNLLQPLGLRGGVRPTNIVNAFGSNAINSSPFTDRLNLQGGTVSIGVNGTSTLTISSAITGDEGVVKIGSGTFEYTRDKGLDPAGSFTGPMTVADGTMELNESGGGDILGGPLVVGDGVGAVDSAVVRCMGPFQTSEPVTVESDGLFDANGFEQALGAVTLAGGVIESGAALDLSGDVNVLPASTGSSSVIQGELVLNAAAAGQARAFTVADGASLEVVATVSDGPVGPVGLTKTGGGVMDLFGDNQYTGTTTVTAGDLEIFGNQPGSPVVLAGGRLSGSGTVGPLTASGGTYFTDIPSSGPADVLHVTGTVNLTGASLGAFASTVPVGTTFVALANDGTDPIVGTFAGVPEGGTVPEEGTVAGGGGRVYTVTYHGGDGNDVALTAHSSLTTNLLAGGPSDGTVVAYEPNQAAGKYVTANPLATLHPFGAVRAGVRVAAGDFNGDGVEDAAVVTGSGTLTRLAVIDGKNGSLLVQPFTPFGNFTGGGFVTAADLDGDGRAEVILTPDRGAPAVVRIYSLSGNSLVLRNNFTAINGFKGGLHAAAGDINDDGTPDLAVTAGVGGGAVVLVFDGKTLLSGTPAKLVSPFFALSPKLRNGGWVAAGDVNGDGFADLAFGGGPNAGPVVEVLSGKTLVTSGGPAALAHLLAKPFFVAGDSASRGGVRVAFKDVDGDSKADLVTASGQGQPGRIRVYAGTSFPAQAEPLGLQDFNPFSGTGAIADGVFVG